MPMKPVSNKGNSSRLIFRLSRLVPKAGTYFHKYGLSATLWKIGARLRPMILPPRTLREPLFSQQELAAQRERKFPEKHVFSLLVPLYNTPESFLREMISSVQAQTYGMWELCLADGSDESHPEVEEICREYAVKDPRIRYRRLERNLGISGNTNACLEMSTGDYISLFDHDDLLHPAALFEVIRTVSETKADFVYTDEAIFIGDPKHIYTVHCKPDFFPDYLRGNNYICHFTSFSRELLNRTGLFRPEFDGSQDHDFVLRATEKAKKIVHIPEILYYWRSHPNSVAEDIDSKRYAIDAGIHSVQSQLDRLGIPGTVESSPVFPVIYRIRYRPTDTPLVSVIIHAQREKDLRTCLDAVLKNTSYSPVELLAAAPDRPEFRELISAFPGVRPVPMPEPFRPWTACNIAAGYATGAQLLFLDSTCVPCHSDWIQELLMYAQRENAGAVAGKIFDDKRRVIHAGLILGYGPYRTAACPFAGFPDGVDGYNGRLYYSQEYSAVSPECVMIPRGVWEQAGPFREYLSPDHTGADLCLRIRNVGYHIFWTPYCILGQTPAPPHPSKKAIAAEAQRFREAWADALGHTDPCYNPNFRNSGPGFSLK